MDFVMSYSFGKDSALALYRLVQQGHKPVALLTTVNPEQQRSWVHGIQGELMQAVADSLQLPLLLCECSGAEYGAALEACLLRAKEELGAEACAFGDIDLLGHREWNEARCAAAGLACLLPLWQQPREALVQEGIDAGFASIVKLVDSTFLDTSFLGQVLTAELVDKIKATGADACGENGEYHTFVCNGPLFTRPVRVTNHGVVDLGTHKAADIRPA